MVFPVPRFFQCLTTLVGCGLGAAGRRASSVANKEHLWRMWSAVVTPLTDAITQVRGVRATTLRFVIVFLLNDIKGDLLYHQVCVISR